MSSPKIAAPQPAKITLEAGKRYLWCSCGESSKQPFCDGSHKGSEFSPQPFIAEKSGDAYLCQCKTSDESPFCDGSHKSL